MNVYDAVSAFYRRYRGKKAVYGKSEEGRDLYAFFVGGGSAVGIAQYAIHAREWITSMLALEHLARGTAKGGLWILPLTNPDGALLSAEGLASVSRRRRGALAELNGSEDFSLWKANAEGVDLNVNFPARWGEGLKNSRVRGSENYIGEFPLCASESRALYEFTMAVRPRYTVSYHTKGEEIYWRFSQKGEALKRDFALAEALSKATGYPLKEAHGSVGGYKDFCIEALGIPAFTVEAGREERSHPLGWEELPDLFAKNIDALYRLSEEF